MTIKYKTGGKLTNGGIARANYDLAQAYLTHDDMTQYVDSELKDVVLKVAWSLADGGDGWRVDVETSRELSADESKKLSEWISGQNSDGLGEGFEQQDFAWNSSGYRDYADIDESEDGEMVSFDWRSNDCALERVND